MKLDCRDKLDLEDGSTCVFVKSKGWYEGFLPRFNLYDSSDALVVKCRIMGNSDYCVGGSSFRLYPACTLMFLSSIPRILTTTALCLAAVALAFTPSATKCRKRATKCPPCASIY